MRQIRQKKLRLLQGYGVFWGFKYLPLRGSWAGYNTPIAYGKFLRRLAWLSLDSSLGAGIVQKQRGFSGKRVKASSKLLLSYFLWGTSVVRAWSWCILRLVKNRSYRSFRYRLGLPSRGQRTRSNGRSTRRVKDIAAKVLRAELLYVRIWERGKYSLLKSSKSKRGLSKRAAKAIRHKKGVIRSKKKKDVWR